ncbi:hypothetical protein [Stenotrophomonas rhizophila]
MRRDRFLAKSFGDNAEGTRAGLVKLFELAATHKSCVIVIPLLNQLKGSLFTRILGDKLSATLIKDRKITLDNGSSIELCTHATLKNFQYADSYLALWGSKHIVEDIEALRLWKSFVLVTWGPEDAATWVRGHDVKVIFDDNGSCQ